MANLIPLILASFWTSRCRLPSVQGSWLPSVHHWVAVLLGLICLVSAEGAEVTDFNREILPIFEQKCFSCHGPEKQKSGLRVDRRAAMLKGGDYGEPTLIPGNSADSFLIQVVSGEHADLKMPPSGDSLSANEISLLRRWIDSGAIWPEQMEDSAEQSQALHWSLQPLAEARKSDSIDSLLEAKLKSVGLAYSPGCDPASLLRRVSFVLTGLPPTIEELDEFLNDPDGVDAAYDRAIERLLDSQRYGERWAQHWLDVIRWAETVGFETNLERSRAWPYRDWVIDALNEDKPYDQFLFEQIAGDTVGQDAALGFLVAGPANLPGQIGRDEEAMRQARQDELDEVIRTVSQSVMGLTVGCARCHNHKFDAIKQVDYYSMQAIFAGLTYGNRRWRGEQNDQWAARVPAAQANVNRLVKELAAKRIELGLQSAVEDLHTERFEPVSAKSVRMEIDATANHGAASLYEFEIYSSDTAEIASDGAAASINVALASMGAQPSASSFALANQTRHFDNLVDGDRDRRQAFPWVAASGGPAWIQIDLAKPAMIDRIRWDRGSGVPVQYKILVLPTDGSDWVSVADTSRRMLREDDLRKATQISIADLSLDQIETLVAQISQLRVARAELARLSAGPQVFSARFSPSPGPSWRLHRGDPMQRRELVSPTIPAVLGELDLPPDAPDVDRRVALAKHFISPDHPLTARVIVNRVWQHHFGTGLVDTPSDFGVMGSKPMHPELLDFLASELIAKGWSIKHLHRLILSSHAFRQASQPRAAALEMDAESRLLWRFPPRRLEAEAIRDSILLVSGNLNLKMGGPGFNLFQQRGGLSGYTPIETFEGEGLRRMIYSHKIRMQSVDVFGAFDCPDAGQMKPKRTYSITPTQSLGLFNSPMVLQQADVLAERVQSQCPDSIASQVDLVFRLALSRMPHDQERSQMVKFVEGEGLQQLCRVLFNTSEFLYIQ
ncbi:DUF1553 domain-containing protein [Rubripirellula sp.]|nr:DUF1553 domain-containing protein [Rubripirellula sp.]